MKLYTCLLILGLSYFLSGCWGEPTCHYTPGVFTIPNLYSIINPKDTFHLNDTLWVRFQVPDTFKSSMGTCDNAGNTLTMGTLCVLLYANNTDTSIRAKPLFYQLGNNWDLQKLDSFYVIQFGIILDNKNIIGIGAFTDTAMIFNNSVNTSPCRLPATSSCRSYQSGFNLYTTFQNGQGTYPLIVR